MLELVVDSLAACVLRGSQEKNDTRGSNCTKKPHTHTKKFGEGEKNGASEKGREREMLEPLRDTQKFTLLIVFFV